MSNNTDERQSDITINDLKNVCIFIDLMSQRGQIKAQELSAVGNLYDRLTKYIQQQETKEKNNV